MPKVSGSVREYSRFGETIGGDKFDQDCRPRVAVSFRFWRLSHTTDLHDARIARLQLGGYKVKV
jgi:hypothetical protein